MKRGIIALLAVTTMCLPAHAQSTAKNTIETRWSKDVSPETVWQSYPRPQLKRELWQNLNGMWNYAITDEDAQIKDVKFEGEILVPFAVESALSGVRRSLMPDERLWYEKEVVLSPQMRGKTIILHFGAVDYECDVWVNGKHAGNHKGGNNPFSFDITNLVKGKGTQIIQLRVSDPTDTESVTRGKQQLNQRGIWYTPVSGIWKTVWIEAIGREYVKGVRAATDIYSGEVTFSVEAASSKGTKISVNVLDAKEVVASGTVGQDGNITLPVPGHKLWSPASPKLYGVKIRMEKGGKILDEVSSYFAFRKVGIKKDAAGYQRFCLNDEALFQYGTLDQGWWPDGLLTPPSEEAMLWDMVKLKEMGFNTIRKHIKVEPELYYYYADSLGIMIWQDMVSGFATERRQSEHVGANAAEDWAAPQEHVAQWKEELKEMMGCLGFYPSITTWVIFNEGWGQHNTADMVALAAGYDKSRIINGVSGWTDRGVGDLYDVHNYPAASMMLPDNCGGRVSVLGEFGGYGLPLEGHLWNPEMRNWGYKNMDGAAALLSDYSALMYDLESLIAQGLSGAIYTQTTDVEGEVNGLITYDREVIKMPVSLMNIMHGRLYDVEGAKSTVLIQDAQCGVPSTKSIEVAGEEKEMTVPAVLTGKEKVKSVSRFTSDRHYANLSLWLSMPGNVKVWLNGVKVLDKDSKQTRQYNQYNISNYSQYLKIGDNDLVVELESTAAKNYRFDYGLRAY